MSNEIKDKKNITEEELKNIAGGNDGLPSGYDGSWRVVCNLQSGWLALRTAPAYDYSNEIGQLYNGDSVQITGGYSGNGYVYVYAPRLGMSGWVNAGYIG